MPLTRHFYEIDEVQNALYYCSSRRESRETTFWCHELIISGYSSEAISVLFESWLWQRGPFYLGWLLEARSLMTVIVDESHIFTAAAKLSVCSEWDNSLWTILTSNTVDRVTPKMPPWISEATNAMTSEAKSEATNAMTSEATNAMTSEMTSLVTMTDEKHLYLYRALYQGKARSAWAISRQIPDIWSILREYGSHLSPEYSACFDILENYDALLGYKTPEYDMAIQCLAVIMLCLSDKKRASSFKQIVVSPTTINIPIGRKAARQYTIPSLALYGTQRGTTLCTQISNGLYDIEKAIKGCYFWDQALKKYQRGEKWVSYDAQTAFYDEYFPDDIPDEWSKEEKMKSHGQGLLNAGEKMTLQRYVRIHFTKPCRLAFNVAVKKLDIECNMTAAFVEPAIEINLKPLVRKYII